MNRKSRLEGKGVEWIKQNAACAVRCLNQVEYSDEECIHFSTNTLSALLYDYKLKVRATNTVLRVLGLGDGATTEDLCNRAEWLVGEADRLTDDAERLKEAEARPVRFAIAVLVGKVRRMVMKLRGKDTP